MSKDYYTVLKIQKRRWRNLDKIAKGIEVKTDRWGKLKITLDVGQAKMENLQADSEVDKYLYSEEALWQN